jgi:hypothetical protein
VLLRKVKIPIRFDVMDEKTEEGKKLLHITDLNKIAFMELILSIDESSSNEKLAFEIEKS